MAEKHFVVYRTTCKIDGKFYIGQHITEDLNDGYLGSGKRLRNAIRKHGTENFAREVLFDLSTFEEMNDKEKELITEDLVKDPLCYNIALGGTGSWWHVNQKAYYGDGRRLGALSMLQKVWQDPEFRSGRADVNRKINEKKDYTGKNCHFFGKPKTEEWKKNHSEKMKIAQLGEKNSQFGKSGRVWMYSEELDQMKKIKKEETPSFLEIGWRYGKRKQKS